MDYLSDKQVVFVTGYLGGRSAEFSDNEAAIRAMASDVPMAKLNPPSKVGVSENVPFLLANLKRLARPQKKIILIGHSKGGAEVFTLALTHPELFKSDAEKRHGFALAHAVSIQGAIGGSVLADIHNEPESDVARRWREFVKRRGRVENFIKAILIKLFVDQDSPGFNSLATAATRFRNSGLLKQLSGQCRSLLDQKLHYVVSRREHGGDDMPLFLKSISKFMIQQMAPSDGLVLESDQLHPEVGNKLVSLDRAGHFSLTGPYDPSYDRRGFTRRLLEALAARG